MFINWKLREITLKIVYYGPALSGKTTNLGYIHAKTNPAMRGELVSLKTREDRTICFNFLQVGLGQIRGLNPKFNLYTAPGQMCDISGRKLVLQNADGIVFVADSQAGRLQENLDSLTDLEQNLGELGGALAAVPFVVQLNKRDLADVLTVERLRRELNCNGAPLFEAVATHGVGVFDTLKAVINLVITKVQMSA